MSWKSYCWLGLICSALLGCSSENADTNSPIIFTQLKALFLGIHASERIDPRKVITRTIIDQSSTPLILVDVLNSDQVATMEAFPGNTLFEVWLGADGSTVTTQNGLLVATRGMGHDLMGADLGAVKRALNASLQGSHSKEYMRSFKYLVQDNQEKILSFTCTTVREDVETVVLFDKAYETRRIIENCQNNNEHFQNAYWIETNGKMRKSIQWQGQNIDLILIEYLI